MHRNTNGRAAIGIRGWPEFQIARGAGTGTRQLGINPGLLDFALMARVCILFVEPEVIPDNETVWRRAFILRLRLLKGFNVSWLTVTVKEPPNAIVSSLPVVDSDRDGSGSRVRATGQRLALLFWLV